jgi:Ca-activated chloride channel family protein
MNVSTALATTFALGLLGAIAHTVWPTAPSYSQTEFSDTRMSDSTTSSESAPVGGLYVQSEDGTSQVFPLRHTDVQAQISGNVARVEVTQTFENPFDDPLEAVYVFPLPDEAAVDDMEIHIGDRVIRGEIKPREEAQAIYDQAVQEGRTAGLLEQERDNIFTQSLANIRPGEQIEVVIRYTESLSFEGGNYEFVFPMVVGPRYIPGTPVNPEGDTPQVPDASRITPPVLPPDVRSGHDIQVSVEIDAGVPIEDVESPSHDIQVTEEGSDRVRVQLDAEDTIPNKDLILRYQVSGDRTQATVLTQRNEQGGHFAAYLIPAVEYDSDEIVPKDVVFLMDTSGSQQGDPLEKSKELMRRMINGLNPDDTFTIIDFSNTTRQLSPVPLENTPENRRRALDYVDRLDANGGTELLNGIRAVLAFPEAEEGRVRSVVLLTDGYIGNDNEILAEVQRRLPDGIRLYSFGVGSSVNRFLLDRLAEVGRGTTQVVRQDEPTQEAAERFFNQINNPVLTDIEVTWVGAGQVPEIYPAAAPDLFENQPLVIFGRKPDGLSGTIRITGTMAGGDRYDQSFPVNFDSQSGNLAIAQLWGRARIKDLMNQMFGGETTSGIEAVTDISLAYRILSQYTAFVAVSEEVRVDPDGTRHTVQVPVELPDGVSYEGIFGSTEQADMSTGGYAPPALAVAPLSMNRQGAGVRPMAPTFLFEDEAPGTGTVDQLTLSTYPFELVDVEGLDEAAIAQLETYLQQNLSLPTGFTGDVVMEVMVRQGLIERIVLNDEESTQQDNQVVIPIRDALQYWQPPSAVTGTVKLTIRLR